VALCIWWGFGWFFCDKHIQNQVILTLSTSSITL